MADSGLVIKRHDSPHGRWEMVERRPDPRLAGLVLRYAGFEEHSTRPVRRREVPGSRVPLIVLFGPDMWIDGQRRSSFVAGLSDRPTITEYSGESLGVQIDLSPLGGRRFLGMPMREVTSRIVPVGDLLGAGGDELVERLADAPTWARRFELVDEAILTRVAATPRAKPEIVWAWMQLERSGGRVPIRRLTDETGWSARHLIERFRDQVGVAPKLAARLLRFERVVASIERAHGEGWADIAYDCGYYDQAHLNRDFREFAGTTPTDYVAALLPKGFGASA